MKYLNAEEVLPKYLLMEIQKHISGEILYIPSGNGHVGWGEKNGSRRYFEDSNKSIKQRYQMGFSLEQLSEEYGLAYETVRKILYKK